ncbi:MAG: hypothetical protein Q4D16_00585 [Eubacteriales bacterium]|nr:hypothetical protein [Eubacteriales bacterium]
MSREEKKDFVGYEYKEIAVKPETVSMYLDCYKNFGWKVDENIHFRESGSLTSICLKRDRKIANKAELTRLQRHFEACVAEVKELKHSQTSVASIWALVVGILGTAFMAGATFAVTHEPPIIWLCILLAVPGFTGWILPCFLYKKLVAERVKKLRPLIENKQEEIYEICEKGHSLL